MGIMDKIFGGKTATTITSAAIKSEIDRSEVEIATLHTKLNGAMAGVGAMTDAEHLKIESDIAATRRAIARLDARVGYLTTELPAVLAAEEPPQRPKPMLRFAPVRKRAGRRVRRALRSSWLSMTLRRRRSEISSPI